MTDVQMQIVVVRLADGRQGAFMGPVLLTPEEIEKGLPKLVDVVFLEPQAKETAEAQVTPEVVQ